MLMHDLNISSINRLLYRLQIKVYADEEGAGFNHPRGCYQSNNVKFRRYIICIFYFSLKKFDKNISISYD
jgi:hypothetical protein